MIIAVDEAVPYWDEAFTRLAAVRPFPGRKLRPSDIRDADGLIVRSVTRVDASLLEGSSVQFVGSATIGMDHLDTEYLKARGIRFTNAAGCNANAVAEYVVAVLMVMAKRKGWNLRRKSLAIIGVGNVGSRVEKKAASLGMKVLLCDPPLRVATGDPGYQSSLAEVLSADILTFHVPLTTAGPYPTYHMIDKSVLRCLSPRQFLINTARGPVISGAALRDSLASGRIEGAVLDVWEGEPEIDFSLLDLVEIGTPHIAGYSVDGKIRATEMMFEELCRHFRLSVSWDTCALYPAAARVSPDEGTKGDDALCSVVLQAYNILRDDSSLRAQHSLPPDRARAGFDRLRNEYPFRPEFRHFIVDLPKEQNGLAGIIGALGFLIAGVEGN
jgi:erythronate-4-phosphate dehydrogenase